MPHYRILFACLANLLVVFTLSAQSPAPRYQGLLWEITGKGITRPSYLYGTMHVPEKLAFNLSDSFFVALRGVDMVSLETDHDIWQDFMLKMREDSEDMLRYDRSEYGERDNYTDLYGQSFRFEAPDSRVFGAMFEYKPMMTNEFLYRSNEYRQDYEEDTYLDLFIFQAGKKLGKTVIGLETMDGSYESVMRARIPDDKEDEDQSREYVNPMEIAEAYRKQDLNALDSLNILLSPGKNFRKYMLEVRNVVMADGIDSVAQAGKSMFSAVGAAHLPGDIGVIEMLRRKGYTLRPVTFSMDTDKKDMTEIENMRYPVKMSRQWSADSTWSAEAPGKFYDTSDGWVVDQSLCADMSNGAYYAVYRMKSFGLWEGQSPAYIAERIDSLIYEKVPGKIQERKRFSTPFPGHEITTRTRRGDIQRYKIFITPLEVIMFITGGNREYAAGDEGTRFMNSIQLNERSFSSVARPQVLKPKHGGCKVTFPAQLLVNTTEDEDAATFFAATVTTVDKDTALYFLTRVDYHDLGYIEEDTFELNIILEKMREQFAKKGGTLTPATGTLYPTEEISFRSDRDSSWYFGKLVVNGPHYYLLGCHKKRADRPANFFDSFSIEAYQWPDGWETNTDTTMHFSVSEPKKVKKEPGQLTKNLHKIGEEIRRKQLVAYRKENPDYYEEPESLSRTLDFPLLGEQVLVDRVPALLNDYPSLDSLQRSLKNRFSSEDNLYVESQNWSKKGDTLYVGEYMMRDTNSDRAIRHKVWVTNSWVYNLTANIHAKGPANTYTEQVFNSFHPLDSTSSEVIAFGAPSLDFLADIYDQDSVVRGEALYKMREFGLLNLRPKHFSTLTSVIENPKFNALKFRDRDWLISAVGSTKNKSTVSYLERFVATNPDSARYRVAVIESLMRYMDKQVWRSAFDMWLQYPVFLGDAEYPIFNNLGDSLSLTANFLPEILQLANQDEYRRRSLGLVYRLFRKGYIKPKDYASLKPAMIRDLSHEISEQQYKEEVRRSENDYNGPSAYRGNNDNNAGDQYYRLLMPFYEKDKQVRALFDRALKYGDKNLKSKLFGMLISNGIAVDQQEMKRLADDDKTRFTLMEELVKAQKIGNYQEWFKDTIAVVRSMLQNNSYKGLDSVRFVSKHKAIVARQPGSIYFFEVKEKKEKKWKLAYVRIPVDYGIQKESATEGYDYYYYKPERKDISVLYNLDTEKEKTEYITKTVSEIRFANRGRYRANSRNRYNRYDY